MRVASAMLYDQLARGLKNNLTELNDLSARLATGKKISAPSGDVLGTVKAMDYKLSISQNDQYGQNLTEANNYLEFNDAVLSQVSNTLKELKNLVYNGSDTPGTAEDRAYSAEEAANLRDYLLDLSNSQFRDRYIYSGFQSDQKAYAYDAVNHYYTFQGDSGQLRLPISKEMNQTINVVGSSADASLSTAFSYTMQDVESTILSDGSLVSYTAVPDPVLGKTSIEVSITHPGHPGEPDYEDHFSFSNFMDMANILSSAWQYQKTDGTSLSQSQAIRRIQSLSIPLEKATKQVLTVQAEMSTWQVHLTDQKSRLEASTVNLKNILTETEDADMTETALELQKLTTSLEALRISSSKILSQSLFDFLT
jgi:flagellar hook-associated protein 3 FlgL